MAMCTAEEASQMIWDDFDSGGELDIEEDPSFPLPLDEDECDPSLLSPLLSAALSPEPSLSTSQSSSPPQSPHSQTFSLSPPPTVRSRS